MSSCFLTARAVCASLAALGLLPAVPALAGVLHSPQGYAVTVPAGWQTRHEVDAHGDGDHTDMMYTHPPHTFPVFRVEVDPQRAATMRNAEAMQAAFIRTQVPGFRVVEQRLRTVAGCPASETAAAGTFQGRPVLMDMIYTLHDGRVYTITLMTTPQTLRGDLTTFERMLKSLRLVTPTVS